MGEMNWSSMKRPVNTLKTFRNSCKSARHKSSLWYLWAILHEHISVKTQLISMGLNRIPFPSLDETSSSDHYLHKFWKHLCVPSECVNNTCDDRRNILSCCFRSGNRSATLVVYSQTAFNHSHIRFIMNHSMVKVTSVPIMTWICQSSGFTMTTPWIQ